MKVQLLIQQILNVWLFFFGGGCCVSDLNEDYHEIAMFVKTCGLSPCQADRRPEPENILLLKFT